MNYCCNIFNEIVFFLLPLKDPIKSISVYLLYYYMALRELQYFVKIPRQSTKLHSIRRNEKEKPLNVSWKVNAFLMALFPINSFALVLAATHQSLPVSERMSNWNIEKLEKIRNSKY